MNTSETTEVIAEARSDTAAAPNRSPMRDEPGYEIWFSLSEDRLWSLGGKAAAAFVGLTTIGVLGAIAVAAAA